MRAVSLFSGAGGFEIGLERAGIQTVLQAENDPWCLSVLQRHWPDCERLTDVRQVDAAALRGRCRDLVGVGTRADAERLRATRGRRDSPASVDLVYGGFPCQDLSVAGNRAGFRGERSSLWFEFHRVLSELRPQWCLIENVPGLLSSANGRDMATVLGGLGDLGYGWAYRVLDARYFGIPQRRRRVFIVGCLGDAPRAAAVLAVCESCGGHPAPRVASRERVAASLTSGAHPDSHMPGRHHEDDENLVIGRPLTARASGYRMDFETETFLVANTVRASDGHHGYSSPRGDGADNLVAFDWQAGGGGSDASFRGKSRSYTVRKGDYAQMGTTKHDAIAGGSGVRRLTPLECERLQGWPDDHTRWTADDREIKDSHRYQIIGNGVASPCAEWIGHRLVALGLRATKPPT